MGYYIAVSLSFPANNSAQGLESLATAARKTLRVLSDEFEGRHVRWMCEAILEDPNRYVHGGNKGDMFVWAGVWNYYSYEAEAGALKTFLLNCWEYDLKGQVEEAVVSNFEKALLLVSNEQSEQTNIYEFSLKEKDGEYLPEVIVRTHDTDLNWNQY